MRPSEKKDLASLIFLLFNVERYLYVTKKLAEATIEALITKKTPHKPTSVRPMAVKRVLEEKGVIIAQPGIRSFALRSIDQISPSSDVNRRNKVFWFLDKSSLHLHASRVNLSWRQFAKIRC
jgi:hypothetical protein